jgi:hypothetical protein
MSDLNSNTSSGCSCNRNNNNNTTNSNQHDSQLSSSISPASTRVFGISIKQIELINVTITDQILNIPR